MRKCIGFVLPALLILSSCGASDVLSLSAETITISEKSTFDVSTLVYSSIEASSLDYSVTDTSILSISGSVITGKKEGTTTVKVSKNSLEKLLTVNVESLKPYIEHGKSEFSVCLDDGGVLDMSLYATFVNCESSDAIITSSNNSGYEINGLEITFSKEGHYAFSMSASKGGKTSESFNFIVDVFERLNLSGKGSVTDPYLISTADDLKYLSNEVLAYKDLKDVYFTQTCDISLEKFANWMPIGTFGVPFEGVYDGAGFKVTDINIDVYESHQGLFGFSSGVIKNVTTYGDIKVRCNSDYVYSHSFVGGVVGGIYNAALVYNCTNYANVHGDSYVGGVCGGVCRSDEMIVGREQSRVVECKNYGTITGDDTYAINEKAMYFGGVVGENLGIITGNINYGKVEVTGERTMYVGGVCGLSHLVYKYGMYKDESLEKYANNDNINYGEVIGYHTVGGVFGSAILPSNRCKNYGYVHGDVCVGGVVGLNGTSAVYNGGTAVGRLEDCYNEGKVYASLRYVGGITSYSWFDIINCTNNGEVTGSEKTYCVAGIASYTYDGDVKGCSNLENGNISGYYGLGGIVGWANQNYTVIDGCVNKGSVKKFEECDTNAVHIGGIVGMLGSTNKVTNSDNYGYIVGGGSRNDPDRWGGTGGIVGSYYSGSGISHCANYGSVKGNQQIGGIAGFGSCSAGSYLTYCVNEETALVASDNDVPHLGCIVGRQNNGTVAFNINKGPYFAPNATSNFGYIYGSQGGASFVENQNLYIGG